MGFNSLIAYKLLAASILTYGIHQSSTEILQLQLDSLLIPTETERNQLINDIGLNKNSLILCQINTQDKIDAFLYAETPELNILAFRGTALPAKLEVNLKEAWKDPKSSLTNLVEKITQVWKDMDVILKDWANDFKAQPINDPEFHLKGKIHRGFLSSFERLWKTKDCPKNLQELIPLLRKAQKHGKKIYLTGHSKGGALAELMAMVSRKQNPKLKWNGIYTFGAPRVGDLEFAKEYNQLISESWRVEYRYDIIPLLPFDTVLIDAEKGKILEELKIQVHHQLGLSSAYASTGKLIYVDENNTILKDSHSLQELRLSHLKNAVKQGAFLQLILDHAPLTGTSYSGFLSPKRNK